MKNRRNQHSDGEGNRAGTAEEKQSLPLAGKAVAWSLALCLLPLMGGCLNPELVNSVAGTMYPTAPGDEPFLLIRVVNDTPATLDVPIVYDDGVSSTPPIYLINGLTPEVRETGVLLDWPVFSVAPGSLTEPWFPAITANLPDGSTASIPFGLQAPRSGVDYDSGDTVIFYITEDPRSQAYMTVSVGVIDGATQPATFSRADPFEAVRLILTINGF